MKTFSTSSLLIIFLLFHLIDLGSTTISKTFENFLIKNYGNSTASTIKRADIGVGGSFGGGFNGKVRFKPVLIIHGITNTAGTFEKIRQYFLNHGYANKEVYATTWGDGGKTNTLMDTMRCEYVKAVRLLIQTVSNYTKSRVNIIGISMGSPITRKAIMGGKCVDTLEDLGPPLTPLVQTYVGVAGANYGSMLCLIPYGSCNTVNGMHCNSTFLRNINSKQRYEGNYIFTIYSKDDDKVGYEACGKIASSVNGQNKGFLKKGMNHDQLILNTVGLQYNLVTHGQKKFAYKSEDLPCGAEQRYFGFALIFVLGSSSTIGQWT